MSKALDISSATARVAPDLATLSDTAIGRSAVDQENLISRGDPKVQVFQRLK